MTTDLAASIVKAISYARNGLEQYFRGLNPKIQVEKYESWIEIVSKKLHEGGLIEKQYQPLKVNEMSFAEIVKRSSYYL